MSRGRCSTSTVMLGNPISTKAPSDPLTGSRSILSPMLMRLLGAGSCRLKPGSGIGKASACGTAKGFAVVFTYYDGAFIFTAFACGTWPLASMRPAKQDAKSHQRTLSAVRLAASLVPVLWAHRLPLHLASAGRRRSHQFITPESLQIACRSGPFHSSHPVAPGDCTNLTLQGGSWLG
jgi:hypothetical protein